MPKKIAPWRDYHGGLIREFDIIKHPSGQCGTVFYRPGEARSADQWFVDYGDGTPSRLILQIGHDRQAVVANS